MLAPPALRAVLGCFAVLVTLCGRARRRLADGKHGHHITGMGQQIVWGLPHVCAIFLILAASGALNVASIASVFGATEYKPLAPLSALAAVALLAGGLAVLVLDLGRPDRLMVAMLHQNPSSVFALNVLLYTGFVAVTGAYLWTMLVRRRNRYTGTAGLAALLWRLVLTTGTGAIFGILAGRAAFHSAVMPPLFIAASLADGLAVFLLVLAGLQALGAAPADPALRRRLGRLLGIFAVAVTVLRRRPAFDLAVRTGEPRGVALPAGRRRRLAAAVLGRRGVARHRRAAVAAVPARRPGDSRRRCWWRSGAWHNLACC